MFSITGVPFQWQAQDVLQGGGWGGGAVVDLAFAPGRSKCFGAPRGGATRFCGGGRAGEMTEGGGGGPGLSEAQGNPLQKRKNDRI